MTNTKICPQCSEVSPVQASSCPRCGRQFKTTAPPANQQNDPRTVIGSFPPNLSQQNQSQRNDNLPSNFAQRPNFSQPGFNLPFANQQPEKSSKAAWWIGGGVGVLVIIGVIVLAVIGIVVVGVNKIYDTPLAGTKWQSEVGAINIFGTNQRYTVISADGQKTLSGDMTIKDHVVEIKVDNSTYSTAYRWTVIGNKLTMIRVSDGSPSVLTRIE